MESLACWLTSSLKRVYPGTPASDVSGLSLLSARNERISFQACLRNENENPIDARIAVSAPEGLAITIRRVGYIPVPHHNTGTEFSELEGVGHIPGYAPDPLFPGDTTAIGPMETQAFWINVYAPAEIDPGLRDVRVSFFAGDEQVADLTAKVDVKPLVIRPRRDFPVTHWFYADALCDWYKVEPYEEKFWEIVKPYMRDLVVHGSGQYVPIFTPPTDGIKRPHQLIRINIPSEGRYEFDFSDVRRWVNMARSCGQDFFQWTHFFWQWGCKYALRIYRSNQDSESLLWPFETDATSDVYRNFLAQFLPEFHKFLREEDLLDKSIFHVSDEPHGDEHLENYKKARAMLKELAPWMQVADALSDIRFGREGITDMPIPSIGVAREYRAAGIPACVYFCCGPRGKYLQRLMDTPLANIRMSGWLFYHLDAKGFLHWGYNYWYKSQTQQMINPFTEQAGCQWPGWPYGDTFVVYPGQDGPLDSIRWEVFAESLQDYALLQSAGMDKDDLMFADLKDYDDFPKTEDWIKSARERILRSDRRSDYGMQARVTGILVEDGKILLVKQAVSDERAWSLPGGRVEKGETIEAGMVREMEEEAGLTTRISRLLYLCEKPDVDPPILHITFLLERISGDIRLPSNEHDHNPIHDVRMVPIDDLTAYGFSEKFMNVVKDGFPEAGSYKGHKNNIGL